MLGSFASPISGESMGQASEAWNQSKWDAESVDSYSFGEGAESHPVNTELPAYLKQYLVPFVLIAVGIWLLEKRRIGLSGSIGGKVGAKT